MTIHISVVMPVTLQLILPLRHPCYCGRHGAGGELYEAEELYSVAQLLLVHFSAS